MVARALPRRVLPRQGPTADSPREGWTISPEAQAVWHSDPPAITIA